MTQSLIFLKIRSYDSLSGEVQFSEAKLSEYFSALAKELSQKSNTATKNPLLLEAMEEYRKVAMEFPGDCHFETTDLLIDILKTWSGDPFVGSLVQAPFFSLEKIPVRSPEKVKMFLKSGISMIEVKGQTPLQHIGRKREVGLKVLIRVRDCPKTPMFLREITAKAIGEDYYAPDVGVALQTIRDALKEALKSLAPS